MINCMIPLWETYPVSPDSRAAENIRFCITQLLLSHMSSISQKDKVYYLLLSIIYYLLLIIYYLLPFNCYL